MTNLSSLFVNGVPIHGSGGMMTQGSSYFVMPGSGSGDNDGTSTDTPEATLAGALALCTADQNDVVYMFAEDNSASGTTDYQSSTLTWNKDLTHIVGVNCGNKIGARSRVAFISTYATASNLFTLSANACRIENIHFYAGVADTNPTGCMLVSGSRNYIKNCHIAGIGNANNDIANAFSLHVTGDENYFEDCVIGLDTIGRGSAANSEIRFTGGATRNVFRNCLILTYADAATHQFILKASAGIDRFALFDNCIFINPIDSAATTMTEAISVTAGGSPNGSIILKDCAFFGATDIENAASGEVLVLGHTATAADQSVGGDAAPS